VNESTLSTRAKNVASNAGAATLGDLVRIPFAALEKMRHCGPKTQREIQLLAFRLGITPPPGENEIAGLRRNYERARAMAEAARRTLRAAEDRARAAGGLK
jgi:hypothetical protein